MTDIPFLALFLIAILFYVRGLKKDSVANLLIGSLFASFAFLVRQTGIIPSIAAPLAIFISISKSSKKNPRLIMQLLSSFIVPLIVFFAYSNWTKQNDNATLGQLFSLNHLLIFQDNFLKKLILRVVYNIVYTIVPILPVFFIYQFSHNFWKKLIKPRYLFFYLLVFLFFYLLSGLSHNEKHFISSYTRFFLPNDDLLINDYAGALAFIPNTWFNFIWIVSIGLICIILANFRRNLFKLKKLNPVHLFIFICFLLVFFSTLMLPRIWAEYVIPFIPFIIIFAAIATRYIGLNKLKTSIIVSAMLLLSLFNAKATHTVGGEIWKDAQSLVASGVDPETIDIGQFAWAPWWLYEKTLAKRLQEANGDKLKLSDLLAWDSTPEKTRISFRFETFRPCGRQIQIFFLKGYICQI